MSSCQPGRQPAEKLPNVFNRSSARALGLPVASLLGPEFTKLFHDAYVSSANRPNLRIRAATALAIVSRKTHVSHHTAVELWGGVAPPTSRVHLTFGARRYRSQRAGIAAHHSPLPTKTTMHKGLPIATPVQAFLDLASAGVELIDLVVAGDSLVRSTGLSPEAFVQAASSWVGNRARVARRAAALIRSGVDSPMETKLRLLLVFAGLPEPKVNVVIRAGDGEWIARFDLCYEKWKLIIEYDGRQHAFSAEQWASDIERREALDRWGWRIIVIRAEDIYQQPEQTLRRVRQALVERGAVVTPRFKTEWTRQFPVRARGAVA